VSNGVDPSGPTLDEDERLLMQAAIADGIKYSQLLINAEASVNLPGLLTCAVEQENLELLSLLIEAGADLEMHRQKRLKKQLKGITLR
jgi:hypothetical protein